MRWSLTRSRGSLHTPSMATTAAVARCLPAAAAVLAGRYGDGLAPSGMANDQAGL
jgi:hypothetical protein